VRFEPVIRGLVGAPRVAMAGFTLAAVVAIELLRRNGYPVPVPFLMIYGSVAIVASVSGFAPSALAAFFASMFVIYATIIGYGPQTFTGGPTQAAVGVFVGFLIAVVVGRMRDERQSLIEQLRQAHEQLATHSSSLEAQVAQQNARLREMATRLLNIQEEERAHVARELHDEVAQVLTGSKLALAALHRNSHASDAQWDTALRSLDTIMEQVRRISVVLRPALLDQLGLTAAIRWYVEQQAERAGLEASMELDDVPTTLTKESAILIFRCVQEAMTNAIKHAQATRIALELRWDGKTVGLKFSDNGRGFAAPKDWTFSEKGGLGIPGMQERFALSRGSFSIESQPGSGTTIVASVKEDGTDG
jgi:signal transduction histidine kinase